jgi:hypothetical protein
MGGVSEEHFMRMNVDPFGPQAAGEIPTQSGRNPLGYYQPDESANG